MTTFNHWSMSPRWEPNPDIRRGRTVVHNLYAHLVFVTKYRRGVMNDEMLTRCEEIMRKVCQDFETELTDFNGETDHVHLFVHYPPKVALSGLVNSSKVSRLAVCVPSSPVGPTAPSCTVTSGLPRTSPLRAAVPLKMVRSTSAAEATRLSSALPWGDSPPT